MVDVLLGLQWGDEGKGKVVDFLAPKYNVVARFQGGPNAGHTLVFDNQKYVLHQVPSGIFHQNIKNVVGNGLVIDPIVFKKELDTLTKHGISFENNLFISEKAHLIIPTHKTLDAAFEQAKGDKKIGSTLRGIGPTYQNKIGRIGLRIGDILQNNFKEKYRSLRKEHEQVLAYLKFDHEGLEESEKAFFDAIDFLKTLKIGDTAYLISQSLGGKESILAEGAQGSMLDIDFGSYPFVTSSNTVTAGALTGLGIAPQSIKEVFGIFKAYCTRVGSGPFPTELFDASGAELAKLGHEFGATTGRPRRCGWLDLPALKYTIMLSGVTQLMMMKADVLSSFEEIKVCTHYALESGERTDQVPFCLENTPVKPIYKTFKGWRSELKTDSSFDTLPNALLDYIRFIEESVEVPISMVSIGADRKETILR